MPNGTIDPMASPRYVLEGRIVTMSEEPGFPEVIPDGAIYIEGDVIVAVRDTSEVAPDGFGGAPVIRTGDTIYPGLMELHNHLCYNAMPLWKVPQQFLNNDNWKDHDECQRYVKKPSQVLGQTAGVVEALVRFTEARCLLGGVTTSQGITLYNANGIQAFYEGIVRNVEKPLAADLPGAGARIASPEKGKASKYLETLQKYDGRGYFQHLSEGVNPTARGWFLNLQLDDGDWAITDSLSGIHSTALEEADLKLMADRGASMVWSPLSNCMLYGATIDLKAARDSGILMGIGCDWAPTGTKNLLGELKVAWLASINAGGGADDPVFTPKEIVAMATSNAARILKWDQRTGSIEPGKYADLVAINGKQGDVYMQVIEARETSLTLVVVGGVPRVGQPSLMSHFALPTDETITIGDSTRVLNLVHKDPGDLLDGLSLTDATETLREAMHNLPAHAKDVDEASDAGIFSGSTGSGGVRFRVVCDFDEEDSQLLSAAEPYAYYVTDPMELEPITLVDDPKFLRTLVSIPHLPMYLREGLPELYGENIPLDGSAEFLEKPGKRVPTPLRATARTLKDFLEAQQDRLSYEERMTIVDQALVLIEENYVHLPFKRAMHAVDPVQRLKLLKHRIQETEEGRLLPEREFHAELTRAFDSLHDLHTRYRLPYPYKWSTAWLPFFVEECVYEECGPRKYIVSKLIGEPDERPESFQPGVELLYWNGVPIERAIEEHAERQPGGNPPARRARALNSLTIRPLGYGHPPSEEWVTLKYAYGSGEIGEYTQDWLVFEPGVESSAVDPESLRSEASVFLGVDPETDEIQHAKKLFFAWDALDDSARAAAGLPRRSRAKRDPLGTVMPDFFRSGKVEVGGREYGYIRIFSFNTSAPGGFVDEFVRLVELMPTNGLIIDVRGNGGGHIHAAERILQVLTPRPIEPERAQFINSKLNREVCREMEFKHWEDSITQSVLTGAAYSRGFGLTPEGACKAIGQRYYGPVVLITDPLCYSATDIFAAGFQDHEIGTILGVGRNTGAGGANVWSHGLLRLIMSEGSDAARASSPYKILPGGADLRVAIRRTLRVGGSAGVVLEDLGVATPEKHLHRMTRDDVLQRNKDLIEAAARILQRGEAHPIELTIKPEENALPLIEVRTRNIPRLDIYVNGRPRRSAEPGRETGDSRPSAGSEEWDVTPVDLQELAPDAGGAWCELELEGYDGEDLVAFRREQVGVPRR